MFRHHLERVFLAQAQGEQRLRHEARADVVADLDGIPRRSEFGPRQLTLIADSVHFPVSFKAGCWRYRPPTHNFVVVVPVSI